jgi:hypothetical protein
MDFVGVIGAAQAQRRAVVRDKGECRPDIDGLTEDGSPLMVDMSPDRTNPVRRKKNPRGSSLRHLPKLGATTVRSFLELETHR